MNSTGVGHTQRQWEGKFFRCQARCYYCQIPLTLVARDAEGLPVATKDHLTPRSRGGSDIIGNIVPACIDCNRLKGDLNEAEFREERKQFSIDARKSTSRSLPDQKTKVGEIFAVRPSGGCDHGIVACLCCGLKEEMPDPVPPRGPRPVEEIDQLRSVEKERENNSWWRQA